MTVPFTDGREVAPGVVELPDAGIANFLIRDCAYYVEGLESDPYQVLREFDTNEVVGFQWPIPMTHD